MIFKIDEVIEKMNEAGATKTPFLFAVDFELTEGIFLLNPLLQKEVLFSINGTTNDFFAEENRSYSISKTSYNSNDVENSVFTINTSEDYLFERYPEEFTTYQQRFKIVMDGLNRGDSYLTNLTIKTPLKCALSLKDIFHFSKATYKLFLPDRWVCFSPECFVRIENGKIVTFPMKGTIDAMLPNAEEIILNDPKEMAEHSTIVDLLRNDVSRIATSVKVNRFRYIDKLITNNGSLLQVSSEIEGKLPDGYCNQLGTLFFKLLPAGSVSGAPKEATLRLIHEAEKEPRGFYTGVGGYFDGNKLESFVLIRYIEKSGPQLYFRSGGGITANSDVRKEYDEAIQKVYLQFQQQI